MKKLLFAAGLLGVATASHAVSYFSDFESPVGAEWSTTGTSTFSGTNILGRFSGSSTALTLSGFNAGDVVNISFDFYALDSWDGDNTTWGPDRFAAYADNTALVDATFSNITTGGYDQSFPSNFGMGTNAAQTGAFDVDAAHGGTLADGYYGNSLYHLSGSAVASGSSMVFTFSDFGLQGLGDESWGIDNVQVASVPEPATCAVLIGGIVTLLRRRRAVKQQSPK